MNVPTALLYMFPIISGLRITTKYGQDFSLSPRANLAISTKFAYLYIDKSGFNVTMHRYSRILLFLFIAALSSCNQYNRILEDVYDNDQAAREWTKGMTSLSADEIVQYSTEMERVDSLNQATVFGILDTRRDGLPFYPTKPIEPSGLLLTIPTLPIGASILVL